MYETCVFSKISPNILHDLTYFIVFHGSFQAKIYFNPLVKAKECVAFGALRKQLDWSMHVAALGYDGMEDLDILGNAILVYTWKPSLTLVLVGKGVDPQK